MNVTFNWANASIAQRDECYAVQLFLYATQALQISLTIDEAATIAHKWIERDRDVDVNREFVTHALNKIRTIQS